MIIIHTKSGAWYITLRNAQHLHLLTSAWFFFVVFWNQILKNWVIVDDVEFYVTETQLVNSTTFQQRIGLEIFLTSFLHRHLHRFPHRFWEIKTEWNIDVPCDFINYIWKENTGCSYICTVVIGSTKRRGLTCSFRLWNQVDVDTPEVLTADINDMWWCGKQVWFYTHVNYKTCLDS